jgi:hypothetical protein
MVRITTKFDDEEDELRYYEEENRLWDLRRTQILEELAAESKVKNAEAGKRSGEERWLKGDGPKVLALYEQLIADGRKHLTARSIVISEFEHRSIDQIDRDIRRAKI